MPHITSIPKKREKPRITRDLPELRCAKKKSDPWPKISLRVRKKWWAERNPVLRCGICGKPIWDFGDLVPDHKEPGKMGGCKDHSEENLQPAHSLCNMEKGSIRNFSKA